MRSELTIVSIGPGDPALMTVQASEILLHADHLFLRTDHHPVSSWLREHGCSFESFDKLYEACDDFDRLYDEIARRLLEALQHGSVCYAVPDPMADLSVRKVYAALPDSLASVRVIPGISASDAFMSAAGPELAGSSLQVVPASSLHETVYYPDHPLLITELNSAVLAGDVKIRLSELLEDDSLVYYMQADASGMPSVSRLRLYELDRQPSYNHLSAALIPSFPMDTRSRYDLPDLVNIMESLRAPQGCPWDKIQTHQSLKPYLVEEAWEAVNAIDAGDMDHLSDELGDVLLQIVFHASIGKSFDEFTLTDVITNICRKMIARHPHVFGNEHVDRAENVSDRWEMIKRQETGSKTVGESLEDVSPGLPSLKYAIKIWKKAMQLDGFKRDTRLILQDIQHTAEKLMNKDGTMNPSAMGWLLFLCTELSHRCGQDAEIILHETADQFKAGFHQMEKDTEKQGKNIESLTFWDECVYFKKAEERK